MNLRQLEIVRMPGFERQGFPLADLGDGLNLIVGPNASGKTTACRAIRGLLWPGTLSKLSPVALVGEWVVGADRVRIQIEGDRRDCQRNGAPGDPPRVPPERLATCFTLTVDDLFEGTDTDTELADEVAREMAGGYDLGKLRELDPISLKRNHGRDAREKLDETNDKVAGIEADQSALRREEEQLDALRDEEREAERAGARLNRLTDARELLSLRRRIHIEEEKLRAFPAGMAALTGKEGETLEEIDADLARHRDALQKADAAAKDARERKARTHLPEQGIPEARRSEQRENLETLRAAKDARREAEESLREADQALASARNAIGDAADADRLDAMGVPELDGIEALHREWETLAARRIALNEQLDALGEDTSGRDERSALTEAVAILREWFEAGGAQGVDRRNRRLVRALSVLLALVGGVFAFTASPWWAALVAVAVVAFWLSGRTAQENPRAKLQERYGRLPLDAPAAWDTGTVGRRLHDLEEGLGQAVIEERKRNERDVCRRKLDQLSRDAAALDERRQTLVRELGIASDTSNLALCALASALWKHQTAKAERDQCESRAARRAKDLQERLEPVNAFLAEFGEEVCASYDEARRRSESVFARAVAHAAAVKDLETAQAALDSAQGEIATLSARRTRLFEAVGLDDGDETGLRERLERLGDYREGSTQLKSLSDREAPLALKLADAGDLLGMTDEALDVEATRLKTLKESYRGLVERRSRIEKAVQDAGRADALEAAQAEREEARDALRACRDAAERAVAGAFLLDEVEAEHQVESRPQVLRQAMTWFATFTRGRYELVTDDAGFRAQDATSGRGLSLDELSRGTRMQLILAVRLAFAAQAEGDDPLPFVLDEVLSSTDPERFQAIADCLLALVAEGRQVFYLTCQPGDAAAWREVAEAGGMPAPRVVDLADVQGRAHPASELLAQSTIRVAPVAKPEGRSLDAYRKELAVGDLDVLAGAPAAHVAHLFTDADDLGQLRRLLQAGIRTWGQLKNLNEHHPVDAYVDCETFARLHARAAVVDAFAQAWRIGRGQPLTPEALQAAGVTDRFIDGLTDLARELDWDAKRLIAVIKEKSDDRTKGFRILDKLKGNLIESGHFDPSRELEKSEIHERVLAAAGPFVANGDITAQDVRAFFEKLLELSSH